MLRAQMKAIYLALNFARKKVELYVMALVLGELYVVALVLGELYVLAPMFVNK